MAEEIKPPYEVENICTKLGELRYARMRRFARLVAHMFCDDLNRDYEKVPEDEVTRMSGALLSAAEAFVEQWED